MSGYVGSSRQRNWKLEPAVLNGDVPTSEMESEDLAVGPAVRIVKIRTNRKREQAMFALVPSGLN